MTQYDMAKAIAKKTKVHFGDVCEVIECYEKLLLKVIATEDYYQIGDVGVLQGITKLPRPVATPIYNWKQKNAQKYKKNWTWAKKGYPKMEFTNIAKICIKMTAEDFFSAAPLKYTSLAREFRQSAGLPEIPEYDGLSEEKIKEYCRQIDEQTLPKYQFKTPKDKERMAKTPVDYISPSQKKKEEMYDEWLIEQDLEAQRENGVAEEDLVRRDPKILRNEEIFRQREKGAQRLTGDPEKKIVEEKPEDYDEKRPKNKFSYNFTPEEKAELIYLDPTKKKYRRAKYGKDIMRLGK